MADKGSPVIVFAGTTYNATDCIQVASFSHGAEDLTYRCGGYQKHVAGDETIQLQFSLALSASDVAKVSALAPGSTGTCEYYPAGNTAGNIKHSTTNATVITRDMPDAAGKIVTMDVTIVWDDITTGAAT